ncbi:MAG: glycosyltransferase [Planctomycetota bacterium]|nr:MAG: glycosyltransferase [Planctomycetota bacterium]REK20772.1 MAG: glycosyltransferase [Planctomycetota bacterium]REK38046.1 MAG: glycosyltransferase [Planctomycetota bacterium]
MTQTTEKRVLFVSYLFPPVGGVGVQRAVKFVKYLPEHGWRTSVLTVENPSAPLSDESLCRDIPDSTIVRRARTYEPGYAVKAAVSNGVSQHKGFARTLRSAASRAARAAANAVLQPDAQILWRPEALRKGMRLLRETPHQAIIATGPPFSSLLVGATLSKRTGLPLILDYRDEWGISNAYWENKQQGVLSNRVQHWMQNTALQAADVLLATTPSSAEHLAERARWAGSPAYSTWIYNGFDSADFPQHADSEMLPGRRFRLTFVGTLWNLNPVGPVVDAVLRLADASPALAENLELVFAGRRTEQQESELDRLNTAPCTVTRMPFVSHDEAVSLMRRSNALLLLNADRPHTQRIVNAKTFEYMAARRPIFVVAPEGDLWDVVRDLSETRLCRPNDPAGIASALADLLERHRCGIRPDCADWDLSKFERRHLAGELAALLDNLMAGADAETPPLLTSGAAMPVLGGSRE